MQGMTHLVIEGQGNLAALVNHICLPARQQAQHIPLDSKRLAQEFALVRQQGKWESLSLHWVAKHVSFVLQ